jgi:CDGSH-type Zn-finger protein
MSEEKSLLTIKVLPNAPLEIQGTVKIVLADGSEVEKTNAHLCRCGASKNKPFCDGSHRKVDFKD